MGRYLGSDCKLCRRAGEKLFLKGTRCSSAKCTLERRNYPPGSHRKSRVNLSDYAIRLREKQKLKNIYGILERQFRKYFLSARRKKGITGLNLLRLLEMRMDNVVYLMGLGLSRAQARQITRHGHIRVNGRKVNIPSFTVKAGDVVEVIPRAKEYKYLKDNLEITKERAVPGWLEFDRDKLVAKILRAPIREDITVPIQESLIVELYSR